MGNLTLDYSSGLVPENMTADNMPRPVYTVPTTDGTSDLSGQIVGALAAAAIAQSRLNSTGSGNGTYYQTLMDNAQFLYQTVSS